MEPKRIPCPERLRRVPQQFSWVDHRLVREKYIRGLSHAAMALYLFLVTVADAEGLSYYADRTAGRLLGMETDVLCGARRELCRVGLIAYAAPFYQVLSLDYPDPGGPESPRRDSTRDGSNGAAPIGEVIGRVMGGLR